MLLVYPRNKGTKEMSTRSTRSWRAGGRAGGPLHRSGEELDAEDASDGEHDQEHERDARDVRHRLEERVDQNAQPLDLRGD